MDICFKHLIHQLKIVSHLNSFLLKISQKIIWNNMLTLMRRGKQIRLLTNLWLHISIFFPTKTETQSEYVVFVCNYIKGHNLNVYMSQPRADINMSFVETFLRTMFELLYELKRRRLQHGDLHAGNVLVATSEFDVYARPTFRVTDFGVRELTGETAHGNDYLHVAEILRQLLEKIQYGDCEGRDRYAYDILRQEFLARHLIETDSSTDPLACNPQELLKKLDDR